MTIEHKLAEKIKDRELLPGIKLLITDIDDTIVVPKDPNFFRQYSRAVESAIARFLCCNQYRAIEIANYYRKHFKGAQYALFHGSIAQHFPEFGERKPNFDLIYDEICKIDPVGCFVENRKNIELLARLKAQGVIVVGLTSSPYDLSRRILTSSGIDPDIYFEELIAYTRDLGPPKMVLKEKVFEMLLEKYGVKASEALSIGDNYGYEIAIPLQMGMKVALIGETSPDEKVFAYPNFESAILGFRKQNV